MKPSPEPKKQSAIEFAKEKLSLNPEASYADVKAQARFEGIPIFPVVYGRAKALLGLVPTAPYGSKSKARQRAAEAARAETQAFTDTNRMASTPAAESRSGERDTDRAANGENGGELNRTDRARARAGKVAAKGDPAAVLESMIEDLKTAVRERDRYRSTLEKVADLIRAELRAPDTAG